MYRRYHYSYTQYVMTEDWHRQYCKHGYNWECGRIEVIDSKSDSPFPIKEMPFIHRVDYINHLLPEYHTFTFWLNLFTSDEIMTPAELVNEYEKLIHKKIEFKDVGDNNG